MTPFVILGIGITIPECRGPMIPRPACPNCERKMPYGLPSWMVGNWWRQDVCRTLCHVPRVRRHWCDVLQVLRHHLLRRLRRVLNGREKFLLASAQDLMMPCYLRLRWCIRPRKGTTHVLAVSTRFAISGDAAQKEAPTTHAKFVTAGDVGDNAECNKCKNSHGVLKLMETALADVPEGTHEEPCSATSSSE